MQTILVIKLGALGDFILADPAFQWIRNHHKESKLVLLTTPLFEAFAKKQGYFDEIIALPRFKYTDIVRWKLFLDHLVRLQPVRIYDLQMVKRTRIYAYFIRFMHMMGLLKKSEWIGRIKSGHAYLEPSYFKKHPLERFSRLFSKVSNDPFPSLDMRRMGEELPSMPRHPYALVIPSASNAFNGAKKWPLEAYRHVVQWILAKGYSVVIIGGPHDDHRILSMEGGQDNQTVIDLTGKTSFENVIALASKATFAVGNDTGPIHMAAASQCPVFVLFSKKAPPAAQVGARGILYHHLSSDDLSTLKSHDVIPELEGFLEKVNLLT